jgi:hypothetical protein
MLNMPIYSTVVPGLLNGSDNFINQYLIGVILIMTFIILVFIWKGKYNG